MDLSHLGSLLFVAAIVLVAIGVNGIATYVRARHWIPVVARLTLVQEDCKNRWLTHTLRVKYYFPVVQYEYVLGNKKYYSDRVSFRTEDVWVPEVDKWGNRIADEKKFWRSWSVDMPIDAFVNPRRPDRSVLMREVPAERRSHYLAIIASGVLCMTLAVLQLYIT